MNVGAIREQQQQHQRKNWYKTYVENYRVLYVFLLN